MMAFSRRLKITVVLTLLAASLLSAEPAFTAEVAAQPRLVDASPAPDSVLGASPEVVTLTFDRALSDSGTWVTVRSLEGEYFNETDGAVNPDNRFTLSVPIAPLPEGRYRVSYQVTSLGGSTFITGRYEFSIDLPEPRLELLEPVSGQGFESPRIPLEMRVHYFDFGQYNNRVHVYLDGEKVAEVQGESYVLEGVEPGVHELTTVLARFEEEELPDTAQTVTIAVGQPGSDRPAAEQASAPTGSEFGLGLENWPLVAALPLVLLGVGIWLGRSTQATPGPAPLAGEGEPPAS